jgi:hypothetical protein
VLQALAAQGKRDAVTNLTVLLKEAEFEAMASAVLAEYDPKYLWIFAYGSLIWNPEFDIIEQRRAVANGWHRSLCLNLTRWRGTRELLIYLDCSTYPSLDSLELQIQQMPKSSTGGGIGFFITGDHRRFRAAHRESSSSG